MKCPWIDDWIKIMRHIQNSTYNLMLLLNTIILQYIILILNTIYIYTHIYSVYDWIMEKAREFQKKHLCLLFDYAKAFDCVDHNKLWKILQEMGILDHLT